MTGRGGKRPGAGRPSIDPAKSKTRPQHQVRAWDEEWEVIRRFADLVKSGHAEACRRFVEKMEKGVQG